MAGMLAQKPCARVGAQVAQSLVAECIRAGKGRKWRQAGWGGAGSRAQQLAPTQKHSVCTREVCLAEGGGVVERYAANAELS